MINFYNLDLTNEATWKLIQSGRTIGCFQIDSFLGQHWSKELKPECIEDLSALIAIVRPGVSEVKIDGQNAMQVFCDRKNNKVEVKVQFESIKDILADTYDILIFQEQSMKIAQKVAGFNLQEADLLRKSIGTKDVALMSKTETVFIEGCKRVGLVDEQTAKSMFEVIRKSQRYQFNASHSISYSHISYWDAYCKANHTIEFFTETLNNAKHKIDPKDEIRKLVKDAISFDIKIRLPSINDVVEDKENGFYIKDGQIVWGLTNIKSIGESQIKNLHGELEKHPETWTAFLLHIELNKTITNNIICVGILDHFGIPRKQMLHELNCYNQLSDREKDAVRTRKFNSLVETLEWLIQQPRKTGCSNKNRIALVQDLIISLKNPPYELVDRPSWIYHQEVALLGCPLTFSLLDLCHGYDVNSTCKEFKDGKSGLISVAVELISSREYIIKQGKNKGDKMGFLTAEDETGKIEGVLFGDTWAENKNLIYDGNTVILTGERSKKGSLVIHRVDQL